MNKYLSRVGTVGLKDHVLFLLLFGAVSIWFIAQFLVSDDNVSAGFFVFGFLYFALIVFVVFVRHLHSPIDVLEPMYAFIVLYSAYSISGVGNLVTYNNGSPLTDVLPTYYLSVIVGLVSFIAGYLYTKSKAGLSLENYGIKMRNISDRKVFWYMLAILAIVAIFDYTLILKLFDYRNIASYTDRIGLLTERTVTSGLFNVLGDLLFRIVLFLVLFKTFREKRLIISRVILGAVLILPSIMSGSKSVLIFYLLFLSIFYQYNIRRIRPISLVLIALLCYPFIVMLSHVRNTTSIPDMVTRSAEYISDDSSILSPFRSGELVVSQNFMNLIGDIKNGNLEFTLGASWVSEILVFIPRFIFPNRPLSLPEFYASYYSPTEYSEGKGFGSFILMDGYYAFGILGIAIIMSIYGGILALAYKFFIQNRGEGLVSYMYAIFYMEMIMNVIRTGVLLSIKSILISLSPFILVLYLSRSKSRITRVG